MVAGPSLVGRGRAPWLGEARRVLTKLVTKDKLLLSVELATGARTERVRVTPHHPFAVVGRGWVAAGELQLGDRLETPQGATVAVGSIASLPGLHTVYNLEVEGAHSYYAGRSDVLVHNACPLPQALKHAQKYGIRPYRALTTMLKGAGLQAHHLIERRFSALFGGNQGAMKSIAVTRQEHQAFTNAWRNKIPYGTGTAASTKASVQQAARNIYKDHPRILKALGLKK